MSAGALELLTFAELHIAAAPGPAGTLAGWWTDPTAMGAVIGALSATARWRELQVLGANYQPGAPLGAPAEVGRRFAAGGPGLYNLARGGPQQAMFADETDAFLQIGIGTEMLQLVSHVGGDVLARLGPAAIEDLVAAVAEIRAALDGRARVLEMHVRPTAAHGGASYTRPLPHLEAAIPLDAVVDVVEVAPPDLPDTGRARAARAIARADAPTGVTRQVRGQLLMLRWLDDPSAPAALVEAAAAHATWLAALIETSPTSAPR